MRNDLVVDLTMRLSGRRQEYRLAINGQDSVIL